MNKQTQAYISLALAMFFSATTFIIGKVLIGVMPVFLLLTIKFLVGSTFFSVLFFFKKTGSHIRANLNKLDIILLLLQAFFGAFLFNLFMLLGLRYIDADYAAIVTCIAPGLIALFSYLILKEQITKSKLVAIMISIIGLLLVSWHAVVFNFHPLILLGMLLVLCAMICGSLFPICVKLVARKVSQSSISLLFNVLGLLMFLPFSLHHFDYAQITTLLPKTGLLIIFYSIAGNVLYLSLWNKGLRFVPANTASLFIGVVPISVTIMAYFLLHEVLTISQVLGMLLILLALILGVERKKKHTNQHTLLTN